MQFLSTLSLRRATKDIPELDTLANNFYPRSPCGERPVGVFSCYLDNIDFYPRSPCGERRPRATMNTWQKVFLSTLSLRRATGGNVRQVDRVSISIHALLAESDLQNWRKPHGQKTFLSTLSLRRATILDEQTEQDSTISIHALLAESDDFGRTDGTRFYYFYPRSPCGERLRGWTLNINGPIFLSTLSLRRATVVH